MSPGPILGILAVSEWIVIAIVKRMDTGKPKPARIGDPVESRANEKSVTCCRNIRDGDEQQRKREKP